MEEDFVWREDRDGGKLYTLEQLSDEDVLAIMTYIEAAPTDFMTLDKIEKVFNEANKRNIKHEFKLDELKERFINKFRPYQPNY